MGRNAIELPLGELTKEAFLVIANETALEIGWRIKSISDAGFIAYTQNSGYSWNGELILKIENQISNLHCTPIGQPVDDWGRSLSAVQTFASKFEKMKSAFTKEELHKKYKQLKKGFVPAYEDPLKPATTLPFGTLKNAFSFFIPVKDYYITPILIDLNLLIFTVMAAAGVNILGASGESMIKWGANSRLETLEGQWWRLLSNCFLHFDLVHLLLNVIALLFIGFLLEPYLGKARFLAAYLLAGITASLASLWWHKFSIGAGASGAIFGMCGVFLALLSTNFFVKSMRNAFIGVIAGMVCYTLVYGFKGGADHAAHLAGLLCGMLIGFAYLPGLRNPDQLPIGRFSIPVVTVVLLCGSFFVYRGMPVSDDLAYEKGMQRFYVAETAAIEVPVTDHPDVAGTDLPADKHATTETSTTAAPATATFALNPQKQEVNTPKAALLFTIQDQGIHFWEQRAMLIKKLDQLHLSEDIHLRNRKILTYCALQIKNYQLMYKGTEEETAQYKPELDAIHQQLEKLSDELSPQKKTIWSF